jgi:hypothetical protein
LRVSSGEGNWPGEPQPCLQDTATGILAPRAGSLACESVPSTTSRRWPSFSSVTASKPISLPWPRNVVCPRPLTGAGDERETPARELSYLGFLSCCRCRLRSRGARWLGGPVRRRLPSWPGCRWPCAVPATTKGVPAAAADPADLRASQLACAGPGEGRKRNVGRRSPGCLRWPPLQRKGSPSQRSGPVLPVSDLPCR